MWYKCFSGVHFCDFVHEVKSSILDLVLFLILYNNNNSDKLDSLYLEIPTALLLDSLYWTPIGFLLQSLYWTPVHPFLRNPQFLVIPVGIF